MRTPAEHVLEHLFGDVNREVRLAGHGHRDRVGGPGVDLDDLAILEHANHGVVGVVLEFRDHHVLELTAEQINRRHQQVVRERAGRLVVLHPPVDARGLEEPDQDRERPVTLDLLQVDNLLVVDLADDDPREFHLDTHGRGSGGAQLWLQSTPKPRRNLGAVRDGLKTSPPGGQPFVSP